MQEEENSKESPHGQEAQEQNNQKKTQGRGFGKTILFGEHFVVYGLPAIASAIGDITIATVEPSERLEIIDARPCTQGYKDTKKDEIRREFEGLFNYFGINTDKKQLRITLSGNLFCTSGVGASAALATSVSRAINELLNKGMDDEAINQAAYATEKAGTGNVSGIDNTCSTFGGMLWFVKNMKGGPNTMNKLSTKKPIEIVLGNTGITQETRTVVEDVRLKKEESPNEFDKIFSDYQSIVSEAKAALEEGDWKRVGELMNKNQEILEKIGVSCFELEKLIRIANENGALGAKLTGTGRGGYMIALTPGKELQETVANAIEAAGFKTVKTTIG